MKSDRQNEGIIYCRVSDKKQVDEGHGLESQEALLRDYMERNGIIVLEVFRDDLTGKTPDRDGLKEAVAFLKKRKPGTRVFIDHLNRIARGMRAHLAIRDAIFGAGGKLESPGRIYADDPEDDPFEMVEATLNGEFRRQNALQTKRRMQGCFLRGEWVFQLPKGYRFRPKQSKKDKAHIELVQPVASIIKSALEAYACGQLATQAEVARFLQNQPDYPRDSTGRVRDEYAHRILTNPFYAGYVQRPQWDVSLRIGNHPALISMETFQAIQKRLARASRGVVRKEHGADFPLRGHVLCGCCQKPLTGYWAKGRVSRHAYYHCFNKQCEAYSRTIRRELIEGQFDELLQSLTPSPAAAALVRETLQRIWDQLAHSAEDRKKSLAAEIANLERGISQLVGRVMETDSPSIISAYEQRIQESEFRKAELKEQLAKCGQARASFDIAFRTAMLFFSNHYKLWISGRAELRRMVLQLVFADRLEYVRGSGFRTALTTSPFTLFLPPKGVMCEDGAPCRSAFKLPIQCFGRMECRSPAYQPR